MIGYIYITTNLITNKKYIGSHHCTYFDKNYFGSGSLLKKALAKYGKENFTCEIIAECDSEESLVELEEYFIMFFDAVNNLDYYNLDYSGYKRGVTGYKHSPEAKRKIGQFFRDKWKDPFYRERFIHQGSDNGFFGKHHSEETRQHLSEVWDYEKHQSEETKKRRALSRIGKKQSDETKRKISDANRGKKRSEETRERISLSKKGRKAPVETKQKLSRIRKENGVKPPSAKGKIYVKNLTTQHSTRIDPSELEKYISMGYIKGRFKKKKYKWKKK